MGVDYKLVESYGYLVDLDWLEGELMQWLEELEDHRTRYNIRDPHSDVNTDTEGAEDVKDPAITSTQKRKAEKGTADGPLIKKAKTELTICGVSYYPESWQYQTFHILVSTLGPGLLRDLAPVIFGFLFRPLSHPDNFWASNDVTCIFELSQLFGDQNDIGVLAQGNYGTDEPLCAQVGIEPELSVFIYLSSHGTHGCRLLSQVHRTPDDLFRGGSRRESSSTMLLEPRYVAKFAEAKALLDEELGGCTEFLAQRLGDFLMRHGVVYGQSPTPVSTTFKTPTEKPKRCVFAKWLVHEYS
jgi:hypothetical protein